MFKKLFPYLIALTALTVSASAAYYSITGLSKLFAGAASAVMIMAGSLEVSKLVIATLLHQYWKVMNKVLRTYLTLAVIILILITSAGIYGFLSSAYQETATKSLVVDKQINLLEVRKNSFEKIKEQYILEKQSLTQNITTLRNALGNNNQSYIDRNGRTVMYSSNSNRLAFERQLESAITKDEDLTKKIQTLNDSILNLETQIVQTSSNSELASELGPLKYLSKLTGKPMDEIINILLLVIIFVFDPLAISLVVVASFAFKQKHPEEQTIEYPVEERVEDMRNVVEAYDDLQDEMKEWEKASLEDSTDWEMEESENQPEDVTGNTPPEESNIEPYKIYTSEEPAPTVQPPDWKIVDEEKEHTKEEINKTLLAIEQEISKLHADNTGLSAWRKGKELAKLQNRYQNLQQERGKLEGSDDLIIKYT
jgi:hypothetical protein